ncbi:hypothetical protein GCM10009839_94180 [Catenulispora yoronensis]|uniref:HTH marR-type domain-containing protein n=1 Tax=Catenulispora yoronensis TaxID=450799 RepID=A0ABP5HAM1_9ACTN
MEGDERRSWTLLTSHGHVLVEIARNPQARVRDISAIIGITERATQSIIADLEQAGYVERRRIGRRTHYVLHTDIPFRHSAQDGLRVGPFLELLAGTMEAMNPHDSAAAAVMTGIAVPEEELLAAALDDAADPNAGLIAPVEPTEAAEPAMPITPLMPPAPAPAPAPGPELPGPGLG